MIVLKRNQYKTLPDIYIYHLINLLKQQLQLTIISFRPCQDQIYDREVLLFRSTATVALLW